VELAQPLAQRCEHRVVRRVGEVGDLDALGGALAAGGADADERGARCARPRASTPWRGTSSQASTTTSARAASSAGQFAASTNSSTPRPRSPDGCRRCAPQRVDLGHAERAAERLHLAVDVRLGDVVEVDERQRGDAAARQRLRASTSRRRRRRRPRRARRGCAGSAASP
jgi:hypothetical protein